MNRTSDHLTWRQILDLLEGSDLSDSRAAHLRTCTTCAELGAEAEHLNEAFRFSREMTPSADLVTRVVARLDPYGPELVQEVEWARAEAEALSRPQGTIAESGDSWATRVRSAVAKVFSATLAADSWTGSAVAVRGSSTASPRILVYETADHTVSISIHLGPDPQDLVLDLVGQMAPKRGSALPPGIVAHLVTADGAGAEALVQPFGEFRFETLRSQPTRLTIDFGTDRIDIGPLPEVGAS